MQLGRSEICKMVHDENPEIPLDFLNELDKFIFQTLRKKTSTPTALIYDLAPLGKWTYRHLATRKYLYGCGESNNDFVDKLKLILSMYEVYVEDKLNKKYEIFGKENHENYIMDKKQKRLQKWKKDKSI